MRIKIYVLVTLVVVVLLLGFGGGPSLAAEAKAKGSRNGGNETGALRRRVSSVRQCKPEGGLTRVSLVGNDKHGVEFEQL